MYKPKYSYMFCISRMRGLFHILSLIKYLNSIGATPYAIIRLDEIYNTIVSSGGKVKRVNILLNDYNIMISEGVGIGNEDGDYELMAIRKSRDKGKTNLNLHFPASINNIIVNPYYKNARKDGTHGICLNDDRSVKHHARFIKDIPFFNTGSPGWDYFKTDECKNEVMKWKEKLGGKILVLGVVFCREKSLPWYEMIIKFAEQRGFKIVLRCHPDRFRFIPRHFLKYWHKEVHRFVLACIGSHYICGSPCSTSIMESFFIGVKVGGSPLIGHYKRWGNHIWAEEKDKWKKGICEVTGSDKFSKMVPLINNEEALSDFLTDKKPIVSFEEARDFFGWKIVPNYCEYFFNVIEKKNY